METFKLFHQLPLSISFPLSPSHPLSLPLFQGFMIPLVKVYSMVAVQSSHVLLGTDSGHILVYDGYSRKKSHQFSPLHDPVLSLQFFKYVYVLPIIYWN